MSLNEIQQMKTKGKSESEILKECLSVLKEMGIFCWRQNTGAFQTKSGGFFRSSMAGVSDIIGILPDGRFLAIECKREKGGVLSSKQIEFLGNIDKNKGIAIVARDSTKLKDVLAQIIGEVEI